MTPRLATDVIDSASLRAYIAEIEEIAKLLPEPAVLDAMAELYPPPQSWFDEGEDSPGDSAALARAKEMAEMREIIARKVKPSNMID